MVGVAVMDDMYVSACFLSVLPMNGNDSDAWASNFCLYCRHLMKNSKTFYKTLEEFT
jgi:hypothetical protein